MNSDQKSSMRKTLGWAAVAYGAFTALSVIGPILLEKFWAKKRRESGGYSPRKR
ncbi:MAG TPA: hypothetical protein VF458_23310 [Ktedonobacteraceae bacterium]